MGDLGTNAMAIVDEELRVFGVRNFRIVDTSIIPILSLGHLQMPAYGIGEKTADMMKAAR
jgi:choline dehydrogenase-like flavoprotein